MYCRNCGTEIEEGAQFCTNCGTRVPGQGPRRETAGKVPTDVAPVQGPRREPADKVPTDMAPAGWGPDVTPEAEMPTHRSRKPVPPGKAPQKSPKKGRGGMIVLIVFIALLTAAIIAGAVLFFLTQRNKSQQVKAFEKEMEAFDAYLDEHNYGSIREEIQSLMQECEAAVRDKAIDKFEGLLKRIGEARRKLEDIAGKLGTLDELREAYASRLEDFVIPESLKSLVDEAFEKLQEAIDGGRVDLLETLKDDLEAVMDQLKDNNAAALGELLDEIRDISNGDIDWDAAAQITEELEEIDALVKAGNYKEALEKAGTLLDIARRAETEAERRRLESQLESEQESIQESIQESMAKAREEAGKQTDSGEYICPGSDSRYLTESDVEGLTDWELMMAINEIYARHGRLFKDKTIQAYFDKLSWYNGYVDPDDFDVSVFNAYEKANVEFIRAHQD